MTSYILPKDMDLPTISQQPSPELDNPIIEPTSASLFWADVAPGSEVDQWATKNLGPMSRNALYDPCRFSAFTVVPVHYLVAKADKAISLATQEKLIRTIEEHGGDKMRVESLQGCVHSPFLSRVDETASFIRSSAGEAILSICK
jgi:hypothetical protein